MIPWVRTRRIKQATADLQKAGTILTDIEVAAKPFSASNAYVPERVERPVLSTITELHERTLPSIAKTVRRAHDDVLKDHLESLMQNANQLRSSIANQNNQYVQKAVAKHSKLLIEELRLDKSQQEATVQDDDRNLVIAAAGSGKTSTLIARVRYLLERAIAPT